jgi:NAD(P)-dependent dehydrogenase (short-subunit alcohol dehydrogenase family)
VTLPAKLTFSNRTALITGAAAGIGQATAHALAAHSVSRIVLVDLDSARLRDTAAQIEALGVAADTRVLDVADLDAMTRVAADVGAVDLLVNAAGNVSASPFLDLEQEEWDRTLASHVKGTFVACRVFVPGMVERRYGRVVNVASVAGKRGGGFLGKTAYSGAKAAVNGLTKGLAREIAPSGVRVNAVNPGLTDTRRLEPLQSDPDVWERCLAAVPLGRVAQPSEIAGVILYLLSDASAYVTGETLNVDGGIAME